MNQPLGCGS
ncbi:ABC transporter ATP-binding protein uup, partial [Haemophilus influenzae]